jgi:hypothetical protein
MPRKRVEDMFFKDAYSGLLGKVERKDHSKEELDDIIVKLTGYSLDELKKKLNSDMTMLEFYANTPDFNPLAKNITGSICGYKIQEIDDEFTWKYRCLDKLVDDLCKNKKLVI